MESPSSGTIGPDDPARRLARLWRRGQRPRVADFLAEVGVSDPALVVTVLRVDQWERRRRDEWVPAESYLDAFPTVKDDPERAVDVIFAEYLLREQLDESPTLDEYARRFPQYADQLKLQVELHRAMGGGAEDEGAWPATWDEGATHPAAGGKTESESGSGEHPKIPGYEILGVLGWGGMGVVYRAWQQRLNRMVALKRLRSGARASPAVLARFLVEAEAVARLQHPNIVQIHEVGQYAGAPFLVLELVEGPSLAQALAGTPQTTQRAVELVEVLARAIHAAHGQGVVHRDLTPTNILLTPDGVPKITDFGLAKILIGGEGLRTLTGELLGTPSYMAPEQAASRHQAIGVATDVYALGAILYELLTGRPPFKAESPLETVRHVVADEPVPPSRLRPKLPRDLETICLKCLHKEPGQRYPTAEALASDLQRCLEGRPILARRSGALERAWRWCRRNPGLAAACTTAAAAVVTLAIVSTAMAWIFRDQRNQIGRQRDEIASQQTQTRENLFAARTAQARATQLSGQVGQRHGSLVAVGGAARVARGLNLPEARLDELRDEAIACLALPDLEATGRVIHPPPGVTLFAFDPTLTRYALRFLEGTILVRRVADDQEIARFQARGDRDIFVFRFSPDGRYLATTHLPNFELTVWDVDRGAVAVNDPGRVTGRAVRFSPDGRRIVLAHEDGHILDYDLATGQLRRRWRGPAQGSPRDLAFGPDGVQIAITGRATDPTCWILETETGRLVRTIPLPSTGELAWSPDGTTLATPGDDQKIYLWEAATGIRKATLEGHVTSGLRAGFHPAGTLLASVDWGDRLRFWDPILGRLVLTTTGMTEPEFSRDGRIVVALGDELTTYQVDPVPEYRTFAHVSSQSINYARASIHRDGRLLAVGTSRGVALWDLAHGTELGFLPIGQAWHLLFEASGELLTSGLSGVQRWPIQLDVARGTFHIGPPRQLRSFPGGSCGIAEDASGRVVALAHFMMTHVQTPERAYRLVPLDNVRSVALSPDGQWLVTGSHGQTGAQVWRACDGAPVAHLAIEGLVELLFSPDGKWLMSQYAPGWLWEAGTWHEARRLDGGGLCFSPDSRLVVAQDPRRVLLLAETATGRTLARLRSPDLCAARWATFSPDGSRLVVTTNDGPAVHVWDLRAIRRRLAELGLDWDAPAYSDDDPADPSRPSLPPLQVDFGKLAAHLVHYTESPATLVERYTTRLKNDPHDADAYHHRAHALYNLDRHSEVIDDLTQAIRLRPDEAHYRGMRGAVYLNLAQLEPAIADLEAALALRGDLPVVAGWLAQACNHRARELASGPGPGRDLDRALALCRRAVAMAPGEAMSLNTMGIVHYRAGRCVEAIATLERSLAAGRGLSDGFDLFFLAMTHHRLGHCNEARACFERALGWLGEPRNRNAQSNPELAAFRAEAVLAGPAGELPEDVFAGPAHPDPAAP
jgi:WD40 repeat protein/tetratricopeptide (TPR) repeat protein